MKGNPAASDGVTRVRLGWEARLDQVTVAINVVVIGVGLVVLGALLDWSGWLTVPMIVIGVVFLLVALLRLQGWRSLVWPRTLTVGPEGISYESKKGGGFQLRWSELAAVGVHSDAEVDARFGLALVFFPKSAGLTGGSLIPLRQNGGLLARLPRRAGVVAAVRDGAPGDWQRFAPGPWDALAAAPGIAPQVIPQPDLARPVVVDIGRRLAGQGLTGGALAAFFGVVAFIAAFSGGTSPGMRAVFAVVGSPFLLLAVGILMSVPLLARRRYAVLDPYAFTWDDPGEDSFALPWQEISSVAIRSTVVKGSPWTWTSGRSLDHVVLHTGGQNRDLPLGDQRGAAGQIGAAVQQFAPQVWRGASTRTGRFEIK
ncbi:hypothetical protein LWP59_01360 [Amycolatopsis acidiphila]|uniref:PH domain-containing protein n=1 Tax=Amycolatopsis acidiphila TaxID=715473 RepID=A0A558AN07_9PSEU|nr:hypothetical protein [Amycolatopsis acidiphila]TVT25621.1 hypothetical protein FNH06_02105 [Amycolatopsis acidiphila]UIJ60376.1 hypothetical protein LWP59_01360 [Amycolatopsis acidiphila]GHG90482.1 hypothetical protein GCM10017788_65970 [Amycolatopsis acidiphila]